MEVAIENIRARFGKRSIYQAVLMGDLKMPGWGVHEVIMPEHNSNVLASRLDSEKANKLLEHFPDAQYDSFARCFLLHPLSEPTFKGQILIITAGTADLPVAREAWLTARYLGHEAEILLDVGVSGIHRLLDKQHLLEQAEVIIVVAGMEGALVSVVGGLVQQPVIAVPTSVGYGAHFQGLAPLLSMLNEYAQ